MKLEQQLFSLLDELIGFSRPRGTWFAVVLLISAVMTSYMLSLTNRFSPEDAALTESSLVNDPKATLGQFFGSAGERAEWGGVTYRPLTMLSLAWDYHRKGPSTYTPFRRQNALLHTLSAVLVYWLTLKLSRRRGVALSVALLFAASPTSSSCVSYITHRGELMAAFGVLGVVALFDWAT